MILCLIVASAQNGVIGKNNQLPWNIPEDLKYFREKTLGKTIIMGRKTFESIGKALPKRRNIVVTRTKDFSADQVEVFLGLDSAIDAAAQGASVDEEVFIVGGGEIYRESLSKVRRAYVTEIHQDFEGDAFFPLLKVREEFKVVSRKDFSNPVRFSFMVYERP